MASEEWRKGYDAAVADAVRMIDAMRGSGQNNLSGPMLLRIRARLLDMLEAAKSGVA
jgi:hypothetical protein